MSNTIKAIIIEDEKMARTVLKGMLEEYFDHVEVVALCADLPSGVAAIKKHAPDLVFLDIEMPGQSGLDLLHYFPDGEVSFSIIFTTAYNQYAIQAFKLSAVDYLLKPIEPEELERSMERYQKSRDRKDLQLLRNNLNPKLPKKIAINTANSVRFVELDNILFFKAEGAYTQLMLNDDSTILVSKGLKNYEEMLAEDSRFYRCHKSYMIHVGAITEYVKSDGGYLLLANKYEVSVSAEKVNELLTLVGLSGK